MAICPKCNVEQPEGLNYCTKCGSPLGSVPPKKAVPTKGLLLGGCGCAILATVFIVIVIVLAVVMMNLPKQGPGATPQPPIVQPTLPTQPGVPPQPQPPEVPQVPVAPQPQVDTYPDLKQGELMIRFAKGLTEDGRTIGSTTSFSTNDPQIVQVIRWGPNTVSVGACVVWGWFYNGNMVYSNYYYHQEGYAGTYDKIVRPANGFPPGEYTVAVLIDSTPAIDHKFTIQ